MGADGEESEESNPVALPVAGAGAESNGLEPALKLGPGSHSLAGAEEKGAGAGAGV